MKTNIVIIVLIVFILELILLRNHSSENINDAMRYIQKGNTYGTIQTIKRFNAKEKEEFISIAQTKTDKIPPIFYIYFADTIYNKSPDDAMFWYLTGRLRAYQDVKMCKDRTAAAQISLYPLMAPKTMNYIHSKDIQYILLMFQKSIEWDIRHPKRVDPVWACVYGIGSFNKQPEVLPMSRYLDIQKQARDEMLAALRKHLKN